MAKSTLEQINKRINELQREAARLREKEVGEVVGRIKEAIKVYGLTAADLGLAGKASAGRRAARPARGSDRSAKYSDGNGNTWGGRGPRPRWLRDAIDAGRTLEEFAVKAGTDGTTGAAPAKRTRGGARKPRGSGKVVYRDDAGNTWSGHGRKPGWYLAALKAGKTPDDLRA